MDRTSVSSSNIASVGYEDGILEVEMIWGGVYQYFNVPADVFQGMIDSSSVGEYFGSFVKGKYEYLRIS